MWFLHVKRSKLCSHQSCTFVCLCIPKNRPLFCWVNLCLLYPFCLWAMETREYTSCLTINQLFILFNPGQSCLPGRLFPWCCLGTNREQNFISLAFFFLCHSADFLVLFLEWKYLFNLSFLPFLQIVIWCDICLLKLCPPLQNGRNQTRLFGRSNKRLLDATVVVLWILRMLLCGNLSSISLGEVTHRCPWRFLFLCCLKKGYFKLNVWKEF